MLGSHFVKMNVYGAGMQIVGKAKDLIIDPETCSLTDLVLELNKDVAKQVLGSRLVVGRKKVSVPISAVDKIGDAVILKFTVDQLQGHIQKI